MTDILQKVKKKESKKQQFNLIRKSEINLMLEAQFISI